ncbi:MAG: C40 family peptidase [Ferruginibacter sp.]
MKTLFHPLLVIIGLCCLCLSSFQLKAAGICTISNNYPTDTIRKSPTAITKNIQPLDEIESKSAIHFQYAIRYNVPVEIVNNLDLFRFMDVWIGTRYCHGGSSLRGIDCSGLTKRLLDDVYCVKASRTVTGQFNQCQEIPREELRQGDLVFFHTTRPGLSHVGIYLGNEYFIHSGCTKGVSIENLNHKYYKNAYRKAGRLVQQ